MSSRIRDLRNRLNRLKPETSTWPTEYDRLLLLVRGMAIAEQDEVVAAIKSINQTTPLTNENILTELRNHLPAYLPTLPDDHKATLTAVIEKLAKEGISLMPEASK